MRWVSSAAQVRALDAATIEELGVPGFALMEVAARGVALAIRRHHADAARRGTVVVCGGGNNGGDGFAVARWLHGWGWPVRTVVLSDPSTPDAAANHGICRRIGVPEDRTLAALASAGLIVDAVFGTGLTRPVRGRYADALTAMDVAPAPVVAVDLPSGVHSDTGQLLGPAPAAATTVTFGRLKPGLLLAPGIDRCGRVEVVDIGLGAAETTPAVVAGLPDPEDLAPLWPVRAPGDHKSRSGHLLVVAGTDAMAGAAVLACRGALRAGAGLVTLATRAGPGRLAALPPEVMVVPWSADLPLERFTAIAAGPGLGGGGELPEALAAWLTDVWSDPRPVVFDADALPHTVGAARGEAVLTPHPGEAARLMGTSVAAVEADRLAAVHALADRGVALLKGRHTLVAAPPQPTHINPTGHPVLATAGSGDVLTGVVGALLARRCDGWTAARLGAWVHGRSGELLAARRPHGWTAGDIARRVPAAIDELLACAGS